ncbi:hypothetical protein AQS8620_00493 [Aquimixticola soesokkakensis]|uniref:Cobalamin biosynthesis protein CbiL n=1 Tax=Aquimixticola soesokkakensis TaxID=1519096 RepID=A0A1Y5RQ70_9RHOB|nr:hypothetical protein [Aquimixticola soesokkakensis]SLN19857.1 hypothetical protein AQS8620_00493 [Aquimixticola soesokkakensis]
MIRALVLLCALLVASPAFAHKLKVFATLTDRTVSGYAFFIGGGRAQGAQWQALSGETVLAFGTTDDAGGFSFAAQRPQAPLVVTVDTREGHIAQAILPPERWAQTALAQDAQGAAPTSTVPQTPATPAPALAQSLERIVSTAVQRETAPLLARIEEMDARMRLTDIISALCLIAGLAGVALWALQRRR